MRFVPPALALALALGSALPTRAELVVLTDGQFFKVRAFELLSEEQMRLTLPNGGRLTLPLLRIERVVADEVPLKEDPPPQLFQEVPAPEPEPPRFSWRFAEDHDVPYTPYGEMIFEVAKRHGINPHLVAAVVKTESNFQTRAVSPKGARGLMQLMPATGSRFGLSRREVYDPKKNLEAGALYLRFLLDRYDPKLDWALAAYNSGEGTVDRYRGVPPYRETQGYIRKILGILGVGAEQIASLNVP